MWDSRDVRNYRKLNSLCQKKFSCSLREYLSHPKNLSKSISKLSRELGATYCIFQPFHNHYVRSSMREMAGVGKEEETICKD